MSILYMEGFEDTVSDADLTARGVAVAQNTLGTRPARYADGTAAVRGYTGHNAGVATFKRRLPRTLTDGIFFSFQFYKTSYNTTNVFGFPIFANGLYISTNSSNSVKTSTDGTNWEVKTGSASFVSAPSVAWDPTRNLYWLTGLFTGSVQTQVGTTPDFATWTIGTNLPGATLTTSGPRPVFDSFTNRMWIVSTTYVYVLEPGSSTWTLSLTQPGANNNSGSAMAIDPATGNRWVNSNNSVYRGTAADTAWTSGGTLPASGTPRGIAFGNDTLVVGTNAAYVYYSTDAGVTFTASPNIPGFTAHTSTWIAFHNGAFYLYSRGGTARIYRSTDGITWAALVTPSIPEGVVASGLWSAGEFIYLYGSTVGNYYSEDGLNWNVIENGAVLGSNANVTNGLSSYINGMVRPGIVINSDDTAYALLSQSSPTSVTTNIGLAKDTWHMAECSVVKTGVGTYQYDVTLNGMPAYSQSFTFADFFVSAVSSTPSVLPLATNGSTIVCASASPYYMTSLNSGMSPANGLTGTVTNAIWTGKQFIAGGGNTLFGSYDGITYRTLFSPGTPTLCMEQNGDTVIVGSSQASQAGRAWRSADGGETWSEISIPLTATFGNIFYEKGVWFAVPAANVEPWQYSIDDGVTWLAHPTRTESVSYPVISRYSARAFGSLYFNLVLEGTTYLCRVTVNSATDVTVVSTNGANLTGLSTRFVGFNGRRLFAHAGGTTTLWYSYDGDSWSNQASLTTAQTNSGFLPVEGVLLFGAVTSSNAARIVVPELLDHPLDFTLDGYSFSRYDDIIVNDAAAPFAGPLGEGRLLKIPLDTADQSQWAPNPTSLTNVEAATQQTVSSATAFVESNEAGQKDIYGTSSFSIPVGYRAAAVQVDGYFTRTLNTIPSARLGVRSGTSEDTTPEIPVTANIGAKVYVSKIAQTNPATGAAWTSTAVANAKVTNERTK